MKSFATGFTIVELLLTLAVLGVLLAAGVLAWTQAKVRAYDAQALVCTRDLRQAEAQYYADRSRFDNYAALSSAVGSVASCGVVFQSAGMTAPNWIDDSPGTGAGYRFTVRHPRGSKTFVVTETSLTANGTEVGTVPPAPLAAVPSDPSGSTLTVTLAYASARIRALIGPTPVVGLEDAAGTKFALPALTYDAGARTYAASVPKVKPGTYTVTFASPVCLYADAGRTCPLDGGTLNYRYGIVVPASGSVDVWRQLDWEELPVTGMVSVANGSNVLARNIEGFDVVSLTHRTDLARTDCAGACEVTDAANWSARVVSHHAFTAGAMSYGGSFTYAQGVMGVRLRPVNAALPMDTTGMNVVQNLVFPRDYSSVLRVTSATGTPLNVSFDTPTYRCYMCAGAPVTTFSE